MAKRNKHTSGFRPFAAGGAIVLLAAAVLGANMVSRLAAQEQSPCNQIKTACADAGFKPGAARDGIGIVVDCIRPVMQGVPQRAKAAKPLPQIDAKLVAACKEKNPNFGQEKAKTP
jgi:hypothetical protein